VAGWKGRDVLEIGCGDGRLTGRLAALGARVRAVEPEAALVRTARRLLPPGFRRRVSFRVMKAGRLRFPSASFDLVLFSWSL
jgi:ubiquinone/menaquinone biosynthesis C-methylase UbiE